MKFQKKYLNIILWGLLVIFQVPCNFPGTLRLVLKPGRELKQTGPYMIPPIRWLDSFEYYAEFDITCKIE